MTKKDERKEGQEEEVNLFPVTTIPFTTLNLTEKAFKKTTQMNRVVTIEQNKRNIVIIGWGLLFIFCLAAAVLGMGDGVGLVPRFAVGFLIFGLILLVKSALMWVGLKLRK
jgi:hypothetical protein